MKRSQASESPEGLTKAGAGDPREPWLRNQHWARREISDRSRASAIAFWVFAIFWNGIAWPMFVRVAWPEIQRGKRAAMFASIFPLVGLGLLAGAIHATLRRLKFGESKLELETLPGSIGGWFGGTIQTAVPIFGGDGVRVTFRCINRVTTGSGKSRSTHENTVWEEVQLLGGRLPAGKTGGSAIPVSFRIPRQCQPTRDGDWNDIVWRISARAAMGGADYSVTFPVPVFKAPQEASFIPHAENVAIKLRRTDPDALNLTSGFDVTSDAAGRRRFDFPAQRNWKMAAVVSAFCLGFGGVAAALYYFDGPSFLALIFSMLATGLSIPAAMLWFRGIEIRVDRCGIERRWRMLGFSGVRTISAADVSAIRHKVAGASNGTPFLTVFAVMRNRPNNPEVSIVGNLNSTDANRVSKEIADTLKVESSFDTNDNGPA